MLEREVEAHFVWTVMRLGGVVKKMEFIGESGAPDRLACMPNGDTWQIELKRPKGGRLSALQKLYADDMARLNQKYACFRTKADVDEWRAQYE